MAERRFPSSQTHGGNQTALPDWHSQARLQTGWCRGDERDMSALKRLGDPERSIMDHLWDTRGHQTVRQVHHAPSVRSVTWPTPPS